MFGFKVRNTIMNRCKELLSYFEAVAPRLVKYFLYIMDWYKKENLEEFERYLLETLQQELKKEDIHLVSEVERDMAVYKFIYKT